MEWARFFALLTAVSFPVIFIATYKTEYKNANNFYALMLLAQAGLMGVFVATDALVFYFFWELGIDTDVFSLLAVGWRKKNTGNF